MSVIAHHVVAGKRAECGAQQLGDDGAEFAFGTGDDIDLDAIVGKYAQHLLGRQINFAAIVQYHKTKAPLRGLDKAGMAGFMFLNSLF